MLTDQQVADLANMQLQLALLDGEEWAIKHVLGQDAISISKDGYQWDIRIMSDRDRQKKDQDDGADSVELDE
jgi:hypothetical protein